MGTKSGAQLSNLAHVIRAKSGVGDLWYASQLSDSTQRGNHRHARNSERGLCILFKYPLHLHTSEHFCGNRSSQSHNLFNIRSYKYYKRVRIKLFQLSHVARLSRGPLTVCSAVFVAHIFQRKNEHCQLDFNSLYTALNISYNVISERLVESLRLPQVPILHAQVFLFFRVLLLRMSPQHLTSLWPTMITELVRK